MAKRLNRRNIVQKREAKTEKKFTIEMICQTRPRCMQFAFLHAENRNILLQQQQQKTIKKWHVKWQFATECKPNAVTMEINPVVSNKRSAGRMDYVT